MGKGENDKGRHNLGKQRRKEKPAPANRSGSGSKRYIPDNLAAQSSKRTQYTAADLDGEAGYAVRGPKHGKPQEEELRVFVGKKIGTGKIEITGTLGDDFTKTPPKGVKYTSFRRTEIDEQRDRVIIEFECSPDYLAALSCYLIGNMSSMGKHISFRSEYNPPKPKHLKY